MIRRSRGRSSSSEEEEPDLSEWVPHDQPKKGLKRGRKPQDFKWTRVLKFTSLMEEDPALFSIPRDLNWLREEYDEVEIEQGPELDLNTFFDGIKMSEQNLSVEDNRLSESTLKLYAEKLIIIRRSILKEAQQIEEEEANGQQDHGSSRSLRRFKLNRNFENRRRQNKKTLGPFVPELNSDSRLVKKRRLCQLTPEEKLDIIFKTRVEQFSQKDVAVLYRVKPVLVQYLVQRTKGDQNFLSELFAGETLKKERRKLIKETALRMDSTPRGISRAQDVVQKIMDEHQVKMNLKEVCLVLKEDLDLRYRPIKRIAYRANHPRSLILRQRFAQALTDQLLRGKTIINVDETWINMKDYSRYRWRRRGQSNSSSIQDVNPRIALISAIDTKGECYFSLTQVNTDSEVKVLFLIHLAAKLDSERPDWRTDTIILVDNASYNTSSYTTKIIRKLEIPVMFSAPYSYEASPIERYFGYLKQAIILDQSQPSGKLQVKKFNSSQQFFLCSSRSNDQEVQSNAESSKHYVLARFLPSSF